MTAKRKVSARAPSARLTDTWHKRPWLTLSTVGTAVAILSTIGPAIVWGIHYYATGDELRAHQDHDTSRSAWQTVQMIRLETMATRNRVNDCDIAKTGSKPMSNLERQACETYRMEFDAATKRLEKAQAEAMATTKEKQGANQ